MDPLIALFAAVIGYLLGAISFARLITRLAAPQADISEIEQPVPNNIEEYKSDSIGATAVRLRLGARYGCLTAILDILKAAIPALAFKLWQPQASYYLIAATMAIVGHNYPIYHGFKGGRGLATVYGGFLVLDWIGTIVTYLVGMVFGVLLGSVVMIRYAGLVLMIPWIWFRAHEATQLAYVVIANALFCYAVWPELRHYIRLKREGNLPSSQDLAEFMGMGSMFKVAQRFSLANLIARRNTVSERKGKGP